MMSLIDILMVAGPSAVAAGAAYGGVRSGLNGTRQAIIRIEKKLDRIDNQTQDNRVEISRIDSRCGIIHQRELGI